MKKILFCLCIIISYNVLAKNPDQEFKDVISRISAAKKNPDSAISIAQSYIPKMKDADHIATLYGHICQYYSALGKRDQAMQYAIKANQTALLTKNPKSIAQSYGLISGQYRNIKLYDKAKATLKKGLFYAEKIQNEEKFCLKAGLLMDYAANLALQKKFDSAIIYNKQALHVLSRAKSDNKMVKSYYAFANTNIALVYFETKKMDSAEYYYNKSLVLSEGTFDGNYRKFYTYTNLSLIYNHRKEYQRAIDTLKAAEKAVRKDEYPAQAILYSYLAQNYKSINDLKNYQKYNDLYLSVNENLSNENQNAILKEIRTMDENLKEEIEKKENNKRAVSFLIIFIIVIITFLILYYKRKQKKESSMYEKIILKMEKKAEEKNLVKAAEQPASVQPNTKRTIPSDLEKKLLVKLNKFEKANKFTNPKLTLASLAADFETNTHYISEIINMHKQKNFNAYINDLRIDYICSKIINDPKYQTYKISYLAETSGFSSHSIFTRAFKNITGISPSTFIEQAQKNNLEIRN